MPDFSRQRIEKIKVVPVTNTAIYAANDALHTGAILLSNIIRKMNHSAELIGITVTDLDAQNAAMSFHFFAVNPATSTITVNAALDIADAELTHHLGSVAIAAGDYEAFADNSAATKTNLGLGLKADSEIRDLYLVIKSKGTPTYTTTTPLVVTLHVRQD